MINEKRDETIIYTEQMGFMISKELRSALDKYAKSEGVKPAVVIRKSIVKYLKEKNVLESDKNYL